MNRPKVIASKQNDRHLLLRARCEFLSFSEPLSRLLLRHGEGRLQTIVKPSENILIEPSCAFQSWSEERVNYKR